MENCESFLLHFYHNVKRLNHEPSITNPDSVVLPQLTKFLIKTFVIKVNVQPHKSRRQSAEILNAREKASFAGENMKRTEWNEYVIG